MTSGGGIAHGSDPVPNVDSAVNRIERDVIGNKVDAAVTTVGTTASLVAYMKGVLSVIGTAGIDDVVIPLGPVGNSVIQRDVDSSVRYAVYLVNLGGNILTNAETAQGIAIAHRVRAGVDTGLITPPTAELNGVISVVIDFTTGDWDEGDLGYIEFIGITATVDGVTTTLPTMRKSFRISQEFDIEAKIDTIDAFHDVPTQNSTVNLLMRDVVGNKADDPVASPGTTFSLVSYIKALVDGSAGGHPVPNPDSSANVDTADVAGNKFDALQTTIGTTQSIIAYVKGILGVTVIADGTLTTDSATVPADTGRTEEDNYWDGNMLMPLTGATAFQPRQIVSFANTGGVFTLDTEHPLSSAPGTVAYVILSRSPENLVPTTSTQANQTMAQVVGNKLSSPNYLPNASGASIVQRLQAIMRVEILAVGTLTTSSATVPADTGRTEATGFFDGYYLMMTSGALSFQPRLIVSHSSVGDVFTLDAENPFTGAPGLNPYVIIQGVPGFLVPAADSTANQTPDHVLGNKADAGAVGDPSSVESLIAYAKQTVQEISGAAGIPIFPASAAPANGISISEVIRAIYDRQLGDGTNAATNSLLGKRATRAAADIFNGLTTALFTVSGGRVLITHFEMEVTTAVVDATGSNTKVVSNPTIGTSVDLCGVLDVQSDEIGARYTLDGIFVDGLNGGLAGASPSHDRNFTIPEGTIDLSSSADAGTGGALVKCEVWYFPLDDGATIVVA